MYAIKSQAYAIRSHFASYKHVSRIQLILLDLLMNGNDYITSLQSGLLKIGTGTQICNEFRPKFYLSIKVHLTFHFINAIEAIQQCIVKS
jgi:hypothetical protein